MIRAGLRHAVLAAGLALAAIAVAPATARDLSAAERAALAKRIEDFDAAMREKRMAEIISVLPPRIVVHLAGQAGVEPEKLREAIVAQTTEVMGKVTIHAFAMKLAEARQQELGDGTPYLFIPTEMTMDAGTGKMQVSSDTLAVLDGDAWYLLDLSDPGRLAMFTQVYPEFAGVQFGGKTMKAVP